jgi:hypothetical protein
MKGVGGPNFLIGGFALRFRYGRDRFLCGGEDFGGGLEVEARGGPGGTGGVVGASIFTASGLNQGW